MYRLTVYDNKGDKLVDEFEDEDEMRDAVDSVVNDLEKREIRSFTVSRIHITTTYQRPFWEK